MGPSRVAGSLHDSLASNKSLSVDRLVQDREPAPLYAEIPALQMGQSSETWTWLPAAPRRMLIRKRVAGLSNPSDVGSPIIGGSIESGTTGVADGLLGCNARLKSAREGSEGSLEFAGGAGVSFADCGLAAG